MSRLYARGDCESYEGESYDGEAISGTAKVELRPIRLTYRGTALFDERDEKRTGWC
ncbi:hypothetical protein [Streptomyces sp. NPDC002133]|uniref:hypothetical protein n=1 Tax=Streptomyces sp. NPDC002133 TaxID=3154409 RepID=UPI0033223A33